MTRDDYEEFEDLVEEIGVHFTDRGVHAVLRGDPEIVRSVHLSPRGPLSPWSPVEGKS